MEITQNIKDRFYARVERVPESGCWLWTGDANLKGYGDFYPTEAGRMRSHRFSWVLHNGEIPEGKHVLHKCDVRCCVNPEHLYIGTHSDNMRDKRERGRCSSLRGEDNPCSKLTNKQREEIYKRALSRKEIQSEIAKEFGVDRSLVSLIKRKGF